MERARFIPSAHCLFRPLPGKTNAPFLPGTKDSATFMGILPSDIAIYAGLFFGALASATLLPGASEAALLGLLTTERGSPGALVAVATAGNVLGSVVNWAMGRFLVRFRERWWFPVSGPAYERGVAWFRRFGLWSLLLSWTPIIGDPLTVAAGVLRVRLVPFLVLVTIGKTARYLFIAGAYLWWSGPA
jgi:membrane protein YqaA with SNARE-associated domain